MITEKSQKLAKKYNCEICHYICYKKSDYNKHLITTKHINSYNSLQNSPKIAIIKKIYVYVEKNIIIDKGCMHIKKNVRKILL